MTLKNICALAVATIFAFVSQSGLASIITYTTSLSDPTNTSTGTGSVTLSYDSSLQTLQVDTSFSGLTGNVTAAHIHCCTAVAGVGNVGVATTTPTFPGFPAGVTSGAYSHLFDLTNAASFNAAFVTAQGSVSAAEIALLTGMNDGKAYFNIHTSFLPGGEIRGFLAVKSTSTVPEPSTLLLAGMGLGLVVLQHRRAYNNYNAV
jgi:hypothetical protein